jgi:DNA-binding LacI/PurR family transcriptional regulator
MSPGADQIVRPLSLADRTFEMIRSRLQSGTTQLSDVLLSERELVKTCKVSRTTVRRALKKLIQEGYLVSHPRQGYRVRETAGESVRGGLLSFLHGTRMLPWAWTPFQMSLLQETQRAAGDSGQDLIVMNMNETDPAEAARRLLDRGVAGAIVDSDDPGVAVTLNDAGIPVVMVDSSDPRIESVTQDNFGGAFQATMRLVERGHRRIAFAGLDQLADPFNQHIRERMGGYLAALDASGLPARKEWRLLLRQADEAGKRLLALTGAASGPTAAVVFWPEILADVGAAMAESGSALDLVVWWGGAPGASQEWASRFPGLELPDGMAWSVAEMARKALSRLSQICQGTTEPPARTLVPVRLVPGGKAS